MMCGPEGRCVESACAKVPCDASKGLICKAGACVDACMGASCPQGGQCQDGQCTLMGANTPGTGTGGGSGEPLGPITFAGSTGVGTGAGPNGSGNSSNGGPQTGRNAPDAGAKGCGCRVGGDTDATSTKLAWFAALLGLGLTLQRRRRSARVNRAA